MQNTDDVFNIRKNETPVFFTKRATGDVLMKVATISPKRRPLLFKALANNQLQSDSCLSDIQITYNDVMSTTHTSTNYYDYGVSRESKQPSRMCTINVTGIEFNIDNNKNAPLCDECARSAIANPKFYHTIDKDKIILCCGRNLRAGRCKDEFMRATLGAVLFPQFYAKDKQK